MVTATSKTLLIAKKLIAAFSLSTLTASFLGNATLAQTPADNLTQPSNYANYPNARQVNVKPPLVKRQRGTAKTVKKDAPNVTPQPSNLISGSARINLKPVNSSATLNIALAVGSVAVIEFPVNDRIYYIHPGDVRFVAIDDQSTLTQNNLLVIRPGNMFLQQTTSAPVASVSVQMNSGLTVTFLVFPVSSPERSANHIILAYNLQDIAEERKRLGLATNFLHEDQKRQEKDQLDITVNQKSDGHAKPSTPAPQPTEKTATPPPASLNLQVETLPTDKRKKGTIDEQKRTEAASRLLQTLASGKAALALKTDAKNITLATTKIEFLDAATALVGCSLTNRSNQPVVVSEAPPEVRLDTYDKTGRLMSSVPLPILFVQRSANTSQLAPQQSLSYAIVFQLPVLMPQQKLRIVTVARVPADEVNQIIAK